MNRIFQKFITLWVTYKTSKKAWLIFAVIILVIIFIIARSGKSQTDIATSVTVKDLVDQVSLSGRTQSASAVNLGFADQGRISAVFVAEGDKVRAGQILARLETSDLDAQLKNARASLVIAQSQASSTTTNLEKITREQDALVANAYRNLVSSDLQAVPKNVGVAATPPLISGTYNGSEGDYVIRVYASSSSSGASFQIAGLETNIVQELTTNTSVPLGTKGLYIRFPENSGYTNTEWIISIPNTRSVSYASNMNAYVSAQATRDRILADARSSLDFSASQSSVVQARIDQAQSSVDSILSQIAKRTIRAPFSGIVANNSLKAGQATTSITSGSTSGSSATITLIAEHDYEVILKTPEISISKLSVGQDVDLTLDAYGSQTVFPGKITSINPAETIIDGVPVYETKVSFIESDSRIRSGMTAIGTIITARKNQVLAIPFSLVETAQGTHYVTVRNAEGKNHKRVITIGMRSSDGFVEVTGGLTEHEQVVSSL